MLVAPGWSLLGLVSVQLLLQIEQDQGVNLAKYCCCRLVEANAHSALILNHAPTGNLMDEAEPPQTVGFPDLGDDCMMEMHAGLELGNEVAAELPSAQDVLVFLEGTLPWCQPL